MASIGRRLQSESASPSATATHPLRNPTTHVTTHSTVDGTSILQSSSPDTWQTVLDSNYFSVVYSTSNMPVDMNGEDDLRKHEETMSSGNLGLVSPRGTVCRIVDFKPGKPAVMHRTQSLDYGILVEGEVEMLLDSGDKCLLKRGDVVVQRGTNHAWRNTSDTEWARMIFVLQDSQPLTIGSKVLEEDLGHGAGAIPASRNAP